MSESPPQVARRTYSGIRLGVVMVILALGFAVWQEIADSPNGCVQRSLSAYFYTPVRPVFVGALLLIGFAMIVMWGKTPAEDAALNVAGLLLAVVALVPTLDANYCSLPASVRGGEPESGAAKITDNDLIEANAETVARSFTALLFALVVILVLVAYLTLRAWSQGRTPSPAERAAYIATWLVAAATVAFLYWLYLDAEDPDSAFNQDVHAWSANIAVGLVIVAVFLAARENRKEPGRERWVWLYGSLGAAMVLTALVFKGGDAVGLFSGWLDSHATFVVEAILIAFIAVFWVFQTIERRRDGAPTY
jgi:cytochrome bd-type quinol oxidase subunit 2